MSTPTTPKRAPLAEVAAAESQRLISDPNVMSVGFGLKFVAGKPTMVACLQYRERAKLAGGDLAKRGTQPVPAQVGGYPTDVIQVVIARPSACPGDSKPTGDRGGSKEDPLIGGTSTTVLGNFHSFPTGYGTLGGICFDTVTGAPMALSNAHVYGNEIGSEGIQPWLPTSEYVEGALKYLFCGGPLSHLFFWTAPSPLTVLLTTAAAAAWIAAIASDAEDPSRWGQRTSAVPPAGATTDRERIHLTAEVPHLPFPGRVWSTKTHWDYTRQATSGATTVAIDQDRPNEHVLIGKRVFTDRVRYRGGDRVNICAELWTSARSEPLERFVVAHCFPIAEPDRMVRRVLVMGPGCARVDGALEKLREPVCVRGFVPQVDGVAQMNFPVVQGPFRLWSAAGSTELMGTSLRIPAAVPLHIACPPSTHVEVEVFSTGTPITVTAISANGLTADQAVSTKMDGTPEALKLSGPEIVRVVLEGGSGRGLVSSICVDKRMIRLERQKGVSRYYTGSLDLALNEPAGLWAVVVIAQTMDSSPTGGDPIAAARKLGGIVDSANVVEQGDCVCTMLYDHTFEVV